MDLIPLLHIALTLGYSRADPDAQLLIEVFLCFTTAIKSNKIFTDRKKHSITGSVRLA
jgi:hypothetical protein